MKKTLLLCASLLAAVSLANAKQSGAALTGDYLEVRTCDIYTGSCVANAEMNLNGKEAMMVWSVRNGSYNGVSLDGLKIIAVVRTDATLMDMAYHPRLGKAVLIVDSKATTDQREALIAMAKAKAGKLINKVAEIKTTAIQAELGSCTKSGCAVVKADKLVEISTRCLGGKDHLCGNEEVFYPPLTAVNHALPAYTEVASYNGSGLSMTWQQTNQRSAFLASFTL